MPKQYKLKAVVQFPEQTTIPKDLSDNTLFDIIQEDIKDNGSYQVVCRNKPTNRFAVIISRRKRLVGGANFGGYFFNGLCKRSDFQRRNVRGLLPKTAILRSKRCNNAAKPITSRQA
jgi:hypothetical protein